MAASMRYEEAADRAVGWLATRLSAPSPLCTAADEMITTPKRHIPQKIYWHHNHHTLPYARRRVSAQRRLKKVPWAHFGIFLHRVTCRHSSPLQNGRYNNDLDRLMPTLTASSKKLTELRAYTPVPLQTAALTVNDASAMASQLARYLNTLPTLPGKLREERGLHPVLATRQVTSGIAGRVPAWWSSTAPP